MNKEKIEELLKELEIRRQSYDNEKARELYWSSDEGVLYINSEDINKTKALLYSIYYEKYATKITAKTFYKIIIDYIIEKNKNKKIEDCIPKEVEFKVYKEFYGIKVDKKVEFGDFVIYNLKDNEIKKNLIEGKDNSYFLEGQNSYILETKILSCEGEAALINADKKNENFINFLYFITKNIPNCWFSSKKDLIEYSGGIAYSEKNWCEKFTDKPKTIIDLDKIYCEYIKKQPTLSKICEICTLKPKNKLEEAIKMAINWCGESIKEINLASSLLKVVIALEVLLSYNEGPINPSILSQISEATALIIGSDCQERLDIEKNLKRIYSNRSAITHSGNESKASILDRNYMLEVVAQVIGALLTEEYSKCTNKEEVIDKLKKKKYSSCCN